jgi:protein SCO1/2
MSVRRMLGVALAVAGVAGVIAFATPHPVRITVAASKGLPYYADRSLTPSWPDARGVREIHRIGVFHLMDAGGRSFTEADVTGRIYVARFFYTECKTLCPDLKAQLARVHEAFAQDTNVFILSHSVMPERDDAARLAHYAVRYGIDGKQWRLLTGRRAELTRLALDAYFVELADITGNTCGRLRHTETLVLVDSHGHIRGVYDGSLAYDVTQLIADIRRLEVPEPIPTHASPQHPIQRRIVS